MTPGKPGGRQAPVIYYRDRSVVVTSHAIEVDGTAYQFSQLNRVWHERDRRSVTTVLGRGGWGLTLIAPVILAVVVVVLAFRLELSTGVRVVTIAAAILFGLGTPLLLDPILDRLDVSFDRGTRRHEIWVERRGVTFRLLEVRDAARFGRIYRAIQRAVEA